MFRNIKRIGHLLTFENNIWGDRFHKVYVPVSHVTILKNFRENRAHGTIEVSNISDKWWASYENETECEKVFQEFLSNIQEYKQTVVCYFAVF